MCRPPPPSPMFPWFTMKSTYSCGLSPPEPSASCDDMARRSDRASLSSAPQKRVLAMGALVGAKLRKGAGVTGQQRLSASLLASHRNSSAVRLGAISRRDAQSCPPELGLWWTRPPSGLLRGARFFTGSCQAQGPRSEGVEVRLARKKTETEQQQPARVQSCKHLRPTTLISLVSPCGQKEQADLSRAARSVVTIVVAGGPWTVVVAEQSRSRSPTTFTAGCRDP